ncbi:MAG: endo-1,3-alpha-glucanase family glycosylhydrolase [Verrucomicrobiota bacterium]
MTSFGFLRLWSAALLICALGTASSANTSAPLYRLDFESGSLKNFGTAGGVATVNDTVSELAFTKDAAVSGWAASLGMSANGHQGAAIQLPASSSELQLAGPQDELTISLWVKWSGPNGHPDKRQGIATNMPGGKNAGWVFSIYEDGRLQFNWVGEKNGGSFRRSEETVPVNEWTHIVLTWRNDDPDYGLQFYINGRSAGNPTPFTGGGPLVATDAPIHLGVASGQGYLPLNGSIARVALYDHIVPIQSLHTAKVAAAQPNVPVPVRAADGTAGKPVFAHYMVAVPLARGHSTVEDYKVEILQAQAMGLDGFALNAGGWTIEKKTPTYKERTTRIYQAAAELGTGFQLLMSADFATKLTFGEFVDMVESFRDHPNQFRHDGRPVISTYKGENIDLTTHAVAEFTGDRAICLVPFYRGKPASESPTLAQIQRIYDENTALDGFFNFGAAGSPEQICSITRNMASVWRGAGKLFMAPVTPYYRGRGGNYRAYESRGFEGMAMHWETAIDVGADWVEIVTWNDWNESSYVCPFGDRTNTNLWNDHFGKMLSHETYMEASRYYLQWFKTGERPAITDDEFYYFYRLHPKTVAGPEGRFPNHVDKLEDRIFATVFLTAPATFKIECGDTSESFELAAGVHHVSTPMADGTPAFVLTRDGVVLYEKQGEFSISPENNWADFNYFASSWRRQGAS